MKASTVHAHGWCSLLSKDRGLSPMPSRDGEAIRCDLNATPHGKRPLNARRLQKKQIKQATLKSANTTRACEMRGSRWPTDASLLHFLM